MPDRFPPIEPYRTGLLEAGDGNRIYFEECGNPEGKPALFVHGGPGSGSSAGPRRNFDPEKYRIILFDQRNCGRSLPNASDPAVDLSANTTDHLIADMELLRTHLGVEQWLLYGGSWGSTLIVAYTHRHPERVAQVVIAGITLCRREDIVWLYQGVGRFFPEEWERFRDHVPATERGEDVFDLLAAYGRLAGDPDRGVRERATVSWLTWEDTVVSLEPNGKPNAYSNRPEANKVAFVRLCAHYFSHAGFIDGEALLADAGKLAGIPAVLIHGRFDLGGPLTNAWELHRAWPGSRLEIVEDSGHTGSGTMGAVSRAALDGFARG
ncbi:prolyl aminopeptidase [Actinospica durhamensis]|uniref:Proline iminopeptidase n=1 Tax=Actinospica durhamensis TaxID=1508375 RepID=A0A941EUV9_9ACTN|nr:prolyl aminopeptidase [Actinospica durhamensis]MBR7835479.1 prolyl aminopeptidase [Actinospica durhamensis]